MSCSNYSQTSVIPREQFVELYRKSKSFKELAEKINRTTPYYASVTRCRSRWVSMITIPYEGKLFEKLMPKYKRARKQLSAKEVAAKLNIKL